MNYEFAVMSGDLQKIPQYQKWNVNYSKEQ